MRNEQAARAQTLRPAIHTSDGDTVLRMGREATDGMGEQQGVFAAEDDEVLEAPVEQANPTPTIPTPIMPSHSDVLKHRESHIPYQSWCEDCVEGRGREMGHRH